MSLTTRHPAEAPDAPDAPGAPEHDVDAGPTIRLMAVPPTLDEAEQIAPAASGDRIGMHFADDDVVFELDGLSCYYGDFEVIRDVSLQIPKQAITAIIGPSGSGKSTLLRCVNYLEDITSGQVLVDGQLIGHRLDVFAVAVTPAPLR